MVKPGPISRNNDETIKVVSAFGVEASDKRFRARKAACKFALQMLSSPQTRHMQAQECDGDSIVNKVEAGGPAAVETVVDAMVEAS